VLDHGLDTCCLCVDVVEAEFVDDFEGFRAVFPKPWLAHDKVWGRWDWGDAKGVVVEPVSFSEGQRYGMGDSHSVWVCHASEMDWGSKGKT
jgi:hypothetical protein